MTWQAFATAAPAMAALAQEEFEQRGLALIGTIRSDGSPRISAVETCLLNETLYLGMMWQSRKARDLLRDPRVLLHNAICSNTGNEVELSLRGRAVTVRDAETRRQYMAAVATPWQEPHFHLFAVDVESAALIRYEAGEQAVTLWPQGVAFKRPYG
jgi:hypothetical protein